MLGIGIYYGRKVKDSEDYATAKGSFTTPVLILTILATDFGGSSTAGLTAEVFRVGVLTPVTGIGISIGIFLMSFFLANKFDSRFKGMISAGDIMNKFYGDAAKKMTGAIGFVAGSGMVGAQIMGLGYLLEYFFGFEYEKAVYLAGGAVVFYSAFGGIKSVVTTDVVQFIILIVMIPLIASVALDEVGGFGKLFDALPKTHLKFFDHPEFPKVALNFLKVCLPIMALHPAVIQRMLMAQNSGQLKNMIYANSALRTPFTFMITIIGLSALALFPKIEANSALSNTVNVLLPEGVKGFAIVGILAVIMSTADSFLNSSAVLVTHDVIKPFWERWKSMSKRLELHLMRLSTIFIGGAAILFAIHSKSIIGIVIQMHGIWASTIATPLFAGIIRMKTDIISFVVCFFSSVITMIIWKQLHSGGGPDYIGAVLMVSGGITGFLTSHLMQNKGFAFVVEGVKEKDGKKKKVKRNYKLRPKFAKLFRAIVKCFPTPLRIYKSSRSAVEKYGTNYMAFGAFCGLNYIIPYFMWSYERPKDYTLMISLRFIAGALCALLLLKSRWKNRFAKISRYTGISHFSSACPFVQPSCYS